MVVSGAVFSYTMHISNHKKKFTSFIFICRLQSLSLLLSDELESDCGLNIVFLFAWAASSSGAFTFRLVSDSSIFFYFFPYGISINIYIYIYVL